MWKNPQKFQVFSFLHFFLMRGFFGVTYSFVLNHHSLHQNHIFQICYHMCIFMPCSTKYLCMYPWSALKERGYSFAGFDTSSGTLLNQGLNILHCISLPLSCILVIIHIEYYREVYI